MSIRTITIFCLFFAQVTGTQEIKNHVTISGTVLNRVSGAAVAGASVFIANTLLGTVTDSTGRFRIRNVPLGSHTLVISKPGFEPFKFGLHLSNAREPAFTFKLTPLTEARAALKVGKTKEWQDRFKKFRELFLGTSQNAVKCEILNPEVLQFQELSQQRFRGYATDILKIDNRALGYRLLYLLEAFELNAGTVSYRGRTQFQELEATSPKQSKKWRENRLATYRGSLRHFLSALCTNRVKEEGFLVYRMPELTRQVYGAELQSVDLAGLLSEGDLSFERKLHFLDYLQVIYTRENESREYIYWRLNHDRSSIEMTTRRRREASRPQAQTSWVAMTKTFVTVDTTGFVYDPLALKVYGYWAWEGIAELLPFEYSPDGN